MSQDNSGKKVNKTTPSRGVGRNVKSFPMASFLVTGSLRPHLVTFFKFARELDDLTDNTDIMPGDKLARFGAMKMALMGELNDPDYDTCLRMAASLKVTGVSIDHCMYMLDAAKQSVTISRYESWNDLLDYCSLVAAPIGRYLLDLYGENNKIYPLSDALCNALQIINHIQDCRVDYLNLDKIHLPQDLLKASGVALDDLEQDSCTPELRVVLNLCLDKVDELLKNASTLPNEVSSKSLGVEAAVVLRVAKKLVSGLRKRDPLSGPVMLNRFQYMSAGFRGVFSFPLA